MSNSVNEERMLEEPNRSMVNRITRDLTDGLLLIDLEGKIAHINPQGEKILNNATLKVGIKYSEFMASDETGLNDEFHQYVLDCIYDKENEHSGTVVYRDSDGNERYLQIKSAFVFSEDRKKKYGFILQFSDFTKSFKLKIKYSDAVKILVAVILMESLWCFIYSFWLYEGQPISAETMTVIIEIVGFFGTLFAVKYTSITVHDFGLGKGVDLEKTLIVDGAVTLAIIILMIVLKLFLRAVSPDLISPDDPFFYWNSWDLSCTLYPLTVFAQELLTRGAAQSSLTMVLPDKTPEMIPIIISSLFFGALHLHKGLLFMLGAAVLLSFFGIMYNRQKTIWGLCIPHYFLGLSLTVLWGM